MKEIDYLSEEKQYDEILNQDEISRIKDDKLREIRSKYWTLQHKAFLDEYNIPDEKLEEVWNILKSKELKEIEEYRKKRTK